MRRGLPGFREVFPTKRQRRIGRTPLKTCIRCGTPNDTRKTAWSNDGSGLKTVSEKVAPITFSQYDETKDESAGKGCRFCGSLNWSNQKPEKLPDDKNLPASGWKRVRR